MRCRNNALAGPFGGCFAIQQTDNAGRTNTSAAAVDTAQKLADIERQIQVNKENLPAAVAANQAAGLEGSDPGLAAVEGEYTQHIITIPTYFKVPLLFPSLKFIYVIDFMGADLIPNIALTSAVPAATTTGATSTATSTGRHRNGKGNGRVRVAFFA